MDDIRNKLSFSMYIDEEFKKKMINDKNITDNIENIDDSPIISKNKPPLISSLHKRKVHQWIKDETVNRCYDCNVLFNFFVRKHHCRVCGRIFCYKCCSKWLKIKDKSSLPHQPINGTSDIFDKFIYKSGMIRSCNNCFEKINEMNELESLIHTFSFLELEELENLKFVSKKWYKAVIFYMSRLREIQYYMPFRKLNNFEIDMLYSSIKYFSGHSRWRTCLLRTVSYKKYSRNELGKILLCLKKNKKIHNCMNMMCTRTCTEKIKPREIIEIIVGNNIPVIFYDYIFGILLSASSEEFSCYTHIINKFIIHNKAYIYYSKIINHYNNNPEILIDIYNNIKYFYNNTNAINEFEKHIKRNNLGYIIPYINENDRSIDKFKNIINKSKVIHFENIYLPFFELDSTKNIKQYNITNTYEYMKSYNKPLMIKIESKNKSCYKKLLLKKEDLRKDYIITKIIKLIDLILKNELKMDFYIINYNVLVINKECGIIEMVDNAETIYNINNSKKFSIQNYIMEHNPSKTIKEVRQRFVRSTAAYCIITYLLGIGDRHLDNIMIHESGSLFHIDYGYIFGQDPKLKEPYVRITESMLDAMGGEKSEHYEDFKFLCKKIYECLRKNINILSTMMIELINIDPYLTLEKYETHVLKKFEPGLNMIEAENTLFTMINESEKNSWKYNIIDFFHKKAN